jgi:hypothetical protein
MDLAFDKVSRTRAPCFSLNSASGIFYSLQHIPDSLSTVTGVKEEVHCICTSTVLLLCKVHDFLLYYSGSHPYSLAKGYCIIYRGPGFLVVVWFGSTPAPFLPPPTPFPSATCLSCSVFLFVIGRAYWGRGGWAWSRMMQPQEFLALYKSFNALCPQLSQSAWLAEVALSYSFLHLCVTDKACLSSPTGVGEKELSKTTAKKTGPHPWTN